MEFTITKEQILEVAKWGNSQNEKQIKEWFPEAFKKDLIVGKWYKSNDYPMHIFFVTAIKNNRYYYYGFQVDGEYKNHEWYSFSDVGLQKGFKLATDEEVEKALIAEARKRGCKNNVLVLPLFSDGTPHNNENNSGLILIRDNNFVFDSEQNSLDFNNLAYRLFCNGKWAEILPEEKTTISKEKALKIIAKKLKVSPENIEIK